MGWARSWLAAAGALWAAEAVAADRAFTLVNGSPKTVTGFAVTAASAEEETIIVLSGGSLAPGAELPVTISSATDECVFNLNITFGDGTTVDPADIDLCDTDGFVIE